MVVAGEDAVNVIQQRTAVAPVIEVRDQNNQPVAGAAVKLLSVVKRRFSAAPTPPAPRPTPSGKPRFRSLLLTGVGTVRINVGRDVPGLSVSERITQTNFAICRPGGIERQSLAGRRWRPRRRHDRRHCGCRGGCRRVCLLRQGARCAFSTGVYVCRLCFWGSFRTNPGRQAVVGQKKKQSLSDFGNCSAGMAA